MHGLDDYRLLGNDLHCESAGNGRFGDLPQVYGHYWTIVRIHRASSAHEIMEGMSQIDVRGFRARRKSAEQDSPGGRHRLGSLLKGGVINIIMVKNVLHKPGCKAALVAVGWISFVLGQLIEFPLLSVPLKVVARVLP